MNKHLQIASCDFILGIDKNQQLIQWLEANPGAIGFAFLGRSNVGKSSVINALFGKKTARVSNTPGRTQQINIFTFKLVKDEQTYYLFDVPGYGHATVSQRMKNNWNLLMGSFFGLISQNVLLVNIQDARHPHQEADQEFLDFIKQLPHEIYLLMNKIDKLKTQSERAKLQNQMKALMPDFRTLREIFQVSAITKQGMEKFEISLKGFLEKKNQTTSET